MKSANRLSFIPLNYVNESPISFAFNSQNSNILSQQMPISLNLASRISSVLSPIPRFSLERCFESSFRVSFKWSSNSEAICLSELWCFQRWRAARIWSKRTAICSRSCGRRTASSYTLID